MSLIDDAKRPVPARAPLVENPRRKYGPQRDALTICATHGEAQPKNESCPLCLSWSESLSDDIQPELNAYDELDEPDWSGFWP
jgi:hypothetical protein